MKTNEVKVNGKTYKYEVGLDLMHWLGKELKTDNLAEIIEHFNDLDTSKGVTLTHLPKFSFLVRGAIICGSKKDLGNLESWCYSNAVTAMTVFNKWSSLMPGNGESDKELVGNLTAAQEAAQ